MGKNIFNNSRFVTGVQISWCGSRLTAVFYRINSMNIEYNKISMSPS